MSAAPLPKPEPETPGAPDERARTGSDEDGWALLEALRRRLDDQAALGRKTQVQVGQLADSIGGLVAEQRRRSKWLNLNSFVAYVIFTVVVGAGFYALYRSRASELLEARNVARHERDLAAQRADDATAKLAAREKADATAWEAYQLLEAGKRADAQAKLATLGPQALSRTERAVLAARAHETQIMEVDAALKAAAASFKAGRYGEVIAPLEAALVGEPAGARATAMHYFLGVAYAKGNDLDNAISHLQIAVATDTEHIDVRFQLASALDRSGQYAKARAEYDTFATAYPQSGLAVFAMRRSATLARMPAVATTKVTPAPTTPGIATTPGATPNGAAPTTPGATPTGAAPTTPSATPNGIAPTPKGAAPTPKGVPPTGTAPTPKGVPPTGTAPTPKGGATAPTTAPAGAAPTGIAPTTTPTGSAPTTTPTGASPIGAKPAPKWPTPTPAKPTPKPAPKPVEEPAPTDEGSAAINPMSTTPFDMRDGMSTAEASPREDTRDKTPRENTRAKSPREDASPVRDESPRDDRQSISVERGGRVPMSTSVTRDPTRDPMSTNAVDRARPVRDTPSTNIEDAPRDRAPTELPPTPKAGTPAPSMPAPPPVERAPAPTLEPPVDREPAPAPRTPPRAEVTPPHERFDAPGIVPPGIDAPGIVAPGIVAPGIVAMGIDVSGVVATGIAPVERH